MADIINRFPGYEFVDGKNMYRDTDMGKGGYIISNPGIYVNVALLDIESLHPNSVRAMNCFGEYTKNFTDILDARLAIKHKDFDTARQMLDGRLTPYLTDESKAKSLAQALKIAINSVYGLTAANFDNPFRDIRNKNNIVALRGALFMRTLQDEIESRGFTFVAIKTDSIKIPNATKEIIEFCMDFAKQYGYTFKHEATYDRMCQINDADYVAIYKDCEWCLDTYGYIPEDNKDNAGTWTATGKQFQVPYVFKKLFSREPIEFDDMCETIAVTKGDLYLDRNEKLPEDEHNYLFVGRVGRFCPIKPDCNGGILWRRYEGKEYAPPGTLKDPKKKIPYRWLEAEMVKELSKEDDIDISFYNQMVDKAADAIAEYGDLEWFISNDPVPNVESPPWKVACGKDTCISCPNFVYSPGKVECKLGHDISDMTILNEDDDAFLKR